MKMPKQSYVAGDNPACMIIRLSLDEIRKIAKSAEAEEFKEFTHHEIIITKPDNTIHMCIKGEKQ